MKLASIFYLLYVHKVCNCGDDLLPPSGSSLNIALSECTTSTGEQDGITYKYFSPKADEYFSTVFQTNEPIWTARVGEECTMACMCSKEGYSSLLTLSIKNANEKTSKPMHFELVNNEWKTISGEEFEQKYQDMQDEETAAGGSGESTSQSSLDLLESPRRSDGFVVDILKRDSPLYTVYDSPSGFHPSRIFIPKEGVSISRVEESGSPIWEGNDDERYAYCIVHLKNDRPRMLLIARDTASGLEYLFLKKKDKGWRRSKRNYFDKIFRLGPKTMIGQGCVLDILSQEAPPRYEVTNCVMHGRPVVSYATKGELCISSVVEGKDVLWESEYNQRCSSCDVYYRGGKPFMVVLDTFDMEMPEIKRYEKRNGKWVFLKEDKFKKRIQELEAKK